MQQPVDLAARVGMAEYRQAERRLGDEDVARHRLERRTGRVLAPLVVARHDDPLARMLEHDLRRAEHMAGGDEADVDLADAEALAIGHGFAVLLAIAGRHDRQRLRRRPDFAVSAARMVGMAVRDERACLRLRRIDPRVGGAHVDAFGKRLYPGTEARHRELYRRETVEFPKYRIGEESFMDETLLGLMEIVGPSILLVLLIWVVLRSRRRKDEPPMDVTERATREEYAEEEQMRREGTDDR